MSCRVTTRGRGLQAPSRMSISSWARSRAGSGACVIRFFQIPPDFVVKSQDIDIVEFIYRSSVDYTSSKLCGATADQGVRCSPHLRPIGLPLKAMECGNPSSLPFRIVVLSLQLSLSPRPWPACASQVAKHRSHKTTARGEADDETTVHLLAAFYDAEPDCDKAHSYAGRCPLREAFPGALEHG